jgi:hypothetical protein
MTPSGNLGLGVTPSAWDTTGDFKALQVGSGFGVYGRASGDQDRGGVFANSYHDGTGWKYIATGNATRYEQTDGAHVWYQAPSGTAGNAISFTQAMTLNASGNLGIGTTSPDSRLHVGPSNGAQLRIDFVSSGDNYYDGVTHYFRNGNGAANIMTLLNGGNVGIGTTSPAARLVASNNGGTGYEIDPGSASGTVVSLFAYDRSAATWRTTRYSGLDHRFEVNGTTEAMRITSGGNVSIGNTNDTYKLDVTGTGRFTNTSDHNLRLNSTGRFTSLDFENNGTLKSQIFWDNTTSESYFYSGSGYMKMSNTGAAIFSDTIKTGDPGLGSAGAIKLGQRFSGTAIIPSGYIPIDIDGTTYYINLFEQTP